MREKLTKEKFATLKGLISDGGWGTEFQKNGGEPGECFEAWNLDKPEIVKKIARSYVDAGCDFVLTNSFGANGFILERHGHADRLIEINKAAARISKEAAGDKAWVVGSLGPCGKLVSMGEAEEVDVKRVYGEQAAALEAGGADALVIETQIDLKEVECALKGAVSNTNIPVGITMTFDSGPEKLHSMMGVTPEAFYKCAKEHGASFVGANCGNGIDLYLPLAKKLCAVSELPVWIKANAGIPEIEKGEIVYLVKPEDFASNASKFFEAGVSILGGCCGTSPEFVKALRSATLEKAS